MLLSITMTSNGEYGRKEMSERAGVMFATDCYEANYSKVFGLEFSMKHLMCSYPFEKRAIIINNVENEEFVYDIFSYQGDCTDIVLASELAPIALEFFNLSHKTPSEGKSYYVDLPKAVALYKAYTDGIKYLCYFEADCRLITISDWVSRSIADIEKQDKVITASPINFNSYGNLELSQIFSSQVFLIPVEPFCNDDVRVRLFNNNSPNFVREGGRYEDYSWFEHNIAKFLRDNDLLKRTYFDVLYFHPVM
ncbi:MAG: hypothetical protein QXX57_00280 [Nitrososphaerota archaeon]